VPPANADLPQAAAAAAAPAVEDEDMVAPFARPVADPHLLASNIPYQAPVANMLASFNNAAALDSLVGSPDDIDDDAWVHLYPDVLDGVQTPMPQVFPEAQQSLDESIHDEELNSPPATAMQSMKLHSDSMFRDIDKTAYNPAALAYKTTLDVRFIYCARHFGFNRLVGLI